jgi:hypothetical protein
VTALLPDTGCPQVVQKPVPGSSLAPHDLQIALGAAGVGAASAAKSGAAVAAIGATSAFAGLGAVSSITAGCAIR